MRFLLLMALVSAALVGTGSPAHSAVSETQPIYSLATAIRETVYVDAPMDSDRDGRPDRIAVAIMRPATTHQVATVMQASPYTGRDAVAGGPPDPGVFAEWYADYFVPRGYAMVEVEMQGTGRSEGCPTTGGPDDTTSVTAATNWLTGRVRGYYADGSPAVATWSTGAIGMIGLSYDGTLAEAAATTGIPGLRTIVPESAISSWYDYARDQGIGYAGTWGDRYPQWQADRVVSAIQRPKCAAELRELGDSAGDATYDYTPFWAARNYRRHDNRIRASVLLAQGLTDSKVRGREFSALWSDLARYHVPRKLWLHKGDHVDPIETGGAAWQETVHRWMDYWLYDIDNGIMAEPMVRIQRPDGAWENHADWPEPGTHDVRVPLRSGRFTDDPAQHENAIIADPSVTQPHRLAYVGDPLSAPLRISGPPRARVRISAGTASTPLTALLIDYPAAPSTGKGILPIVARGAVDVKNRHSLRSDVPLTPGRQYTVSWQLHATDYVFPAGDRIGIVLVANDSDYVTPDPAAGGITVTSGTLTLPVAP